jgi:dolichol-phosphate mannosyltransferase
MKLSVVIPAYNEVDSIAATVTGVVGVLEREQIDHEVLVVDDGSSDGTADALEGDHGGNERVRSIRSGYSGGFGLAIRAGLEHFSGDAVALVMADGSDDPEDLVRYHRLLEDGYDCAFGSRFIHGGEVHDYPAFKLVINRVVNWGIRLLFRHRYDDTTNAFKAYRREVIDAIQPLLSNHFNLTVEMPLKAVVRGYSYAITPISWTNRQAGTAKLSLQEMGSRYLFIVLYVFLEHHLSRGDYRRGDYREAPGGGQQARRSFAGQAGRQPLACDVQCRRPPGRARWRPRCDASTPSSAS